MPYLYSSPNGVRVLNFKWAFFKKKFCHESFLWGYWYPSFGLLVMSPLGFKARVGSFIHTWQRCMCYVCPEIHLCCDTCQPLGSQHGSRADLFHVPDSRHCWSLKLGPIMPQTNALPTELCWLGLTSNLHGTVIKMTQHILDSSSIIFPKHSSCEVIRVYQFCIKTKDWMVPYAGSVSQSGIRCCVWHWPGLMGSVNTGRERLIRSHSSARFCFELSGNSN